MVDRIEFVPAVGAAGEPLRQGPEGAQRKPYYVAVHSGSSWGWARKKGKGSSKRFVVYSPEWASPEDFLPKISNMFRLGQLTVDWVEAKNNPYWLAQGNPYAQYETDVNLPGLKAKKGEKFYYSWIAPEGHERHKEVVPISEAQKGAAPGWTLALAYKMEAKFGKRYPIFKLFYNGQDSGKYAQTAERAAILSHKLDPSTMKKWGRGKKAKGNPIWVTPSGTAGYLSADEGPNVAGTKFGSHSRYKAKHPTRGRVPKFMERQVRLEAPRGELPAGFSIVETVVIERDQPVSHYKIHRGGRDTGKFARDWNKAVAIAHKLAKKLTSARPNPRKKVSSYLRFYRMEKDKGVAPAAIRAAWAAKKAKTKVKKTVVDTALGDIYALADSLFPPSINSLGQRKRGSDFIHETAMFDVDQEGKSIRADLYRSRDTKSKKGWSSANVDTPEFIKGLRAIQKKYKPYGLKMTVAVSNPSGRQW